MFEDLTKSRRGFLRGLTTLPLIGGGITLIGQPTAVAEPVTRELVMNYHSWRQGEHWALSWELAGGNTSSPITFTAPASLIPGGATSDEALMAGRRRQLARHWCSAPLAAPGERTTTSDLSTSRRAEPWMISVQTASKSGPGV
jgi:hypothetical protein